MIFQEDSDMHQPYSHVSLVSYARGDFALFPHHSCVEVFLHQQDEIG